MEWSPSAIDAWESIRNVEGQDYSVWMGPMLLALMRHTLPGSLLRAALLDRSVWPNPENVIHGRVTESSGFMIYDLPPSAERAAENERARRVGERHIAMALQERGQAAFNSSGLQVARLVAKVRDLELGPGFQRSEIEGRWHGLIDTSIAIQYQNLPQIDWLAETGEKPVTIWISPVLLDELDDLKFNSRNLRVRNRAQAFTRWVNPLIAKAVTAGGAPMPDRPNVVLRAWAPTLQQGAPDSRHLEAAYALLDRQVPVRLITGDSGQRLRALASGIEVFDLDERLLLPTEESEERVRAGRLADQRRADIKPFLRPRWMGTPDHFPFAVYNVGGAAHDFVWVGSGRGRLYVARGSAPAHFTDYMVFVAMDLGSIPTENEIAAMGAETLWLVAKDADGEWWDCASDQRVKDGPRAYLAAELERRGLSDFAGRVFEVGMLE